MPSQVELWRTREAQRRPNQFLVYLLQNQAKLLPFSAVSASLRETALTAFAQEPCFSLARSSRFSVIHLRRRERRGNLNRQGVNSVRCFDFLCDRCGSARKCFHRIFRSWVYSDFSLSRFRRLVVQSSGSQRLFLPTDRI